MNNAFTPSQVMVDLGDRSYPIFLTQAMDRLGEAITEHLMPSRILVVADGTVASLYAQPVLDSLAKAGLKADLFTFEPGEQAKCLAQAGKIFDWIFEQKADRKSAVLALGGGVTGDLTGFIAATYMRGVPFIQVPTSLLAQVDSSVGGKVAVNHPLGKNMIGAFHQPSLVYTDITTLKTLTADEFAAGMAEVIKHGVIRDADYFSLIEDEREAIAARDPEVMSRVVAGSCRIKAAVVSEDERETGVRAILNLGHTFGHAFEALTHYKGYRHGEAVAIGMLAAARLGEALTGFSPQETARLEQLLKACHLPTTFNNLEVDAILQSMFGDKKTEHGVLRLVLPHRLGHATVESVTDLDRVKAAIASIKA